MQGRPCRRMNDAVWVMHGDVFVPMAKQSRSGASAGTTNDNTTTGRGRGQAGGGMQLGGKHNREGVLRRARQVEATYKRI